MNDRESTRPLVLLAALAFVVTAAVLAVVFPLATYTTTLALLGLPHVVAELRYVDARFAPRAGPRLLRLLALLIGGVVLLRVAGLLALAPASTLGALELVLVALLAATTLPALARRGAAGPLALALAVIAALGLGAVYGSGTTLVTLALLHNLTPVGLLAERLAGGRRARALLACAVVFLAVPALLASGLVHGLLADAVRLDATPFTSAGAIERSLVAFVPPPLLGAAWAIPLFSAAAFLQVMHYAVVLHVLPRLDDDATWSRPRSAFTWPRPRVFVGLVVLAGLLLLPLFLRDFLLARRVYGVAAAIHAWLEVPALLLAFLPDTAPVAATRSEPGRVEALVGAV